MTSVGGNVSCRTLETNNLISSKIESVKTSNKIELLNSNETRWSLGLDEDKNFVLRNEITNQNSLIANNDTGLCTVLGGFNLADLGDVDSQDLSHNKILRYDSSIEKFNFTDKPHVAEIQADNFIEVQNYQKFDSHETNVNDLKYIKMSLTYNEDTPAIDFYPSIKLTNATTSGFIELGTPTLTSKTNSIVINATPDVIQAADTSRCYIAPIRKKTSSINSDISFDDILTYNTSKEVQYTTKPILKQAYIDLLEANRISADHVVSNAINFDHHSCKQSFEKNNMSGLNNHHLAMFQITNMSSSLYYKSGHIQLHFVIDQPDGYTPNGGGIAHKHIRFQTFPTNDIELYKINTDGQLSDVTFKASFHSLSNQNTLIISYQTSNDRITAISGTCELTFTGASVNVLIPVF
tara:strand:- start:676 stop:1899 length:1224 start_codon:yes stop_codon:yes gene_type:complete